MARFDLAVVNGTLVIPFSGTLRADVAARDGRIVHLAESIDPSEAEEVVDARGKLVFPGLGDNQALRGEPVHLRLVSRKEYVGGRAFLNLFSERLRWAIDDTDIDFWVLCLKDGE